VSLSAIRDFYKFSIVSPMERRSKRPELFSCSVFPREPDTARVRELVGEGKEEKEKEKSELTEQRRSIVNFVDGIGSRDREIDRGRTRTSRKEESSFTSAESLVLLEDQ